MTQDAQDARLKEALSELAGETFNAYDLDMCGVQALLPGAVLTGKCYFLQRPARGAVTEDELNYAIPNKNTSELNFEVMEATIKSTFDKAAQDLDRYWEVHVHGMIVTQPTEEGGRDFIEIANHYGGYLSEGSDTKAFLDWFLLKKMSGLDTMLSSALNITLEP